MVPEGLQKNIKQTLPEAQLRETTLPLLPEMHLYLLDPVNLQRLFSRQETRKIVRNAPYWSFCWASGQALGAYISQRMALIKGKKVLDFGSGSGVVAIASARAGAERVIACDSDKHALEAIRANAKLNQVAVETIRSLDALKGQVDMILVADLLYDSENFPLLDRFFDYTDQILLADSRIKHFQHPRYYQIDHLTAETIPDLKEGEAFNRVQIYRGAWPENSNKLAWLHKDRSIIMYYHPPIHSDQCSFMVRPRIVPEYEADDISP